MKKIFLLFIGAGLVMTSCVSNPEGEKAEVTEAQEVSTDIDGVEYQIDVNESSLVWTGRKVSASHHGTIDFASGSILVDNNMISGGNFVVDMNTIVDEDLEGEWKEKLEGHLRSEDFFNVEVYPESTFEITSVTDNGDNTASISGNLTIIGVTKNITFPAEISELTESTVAFSADFNIEREDWGIMYEGMKDDLIAKEINYKINVVANN